MEFAVKDDSRSPSPFHDAGSAKKRRFLSRSDEEIIDEIDCRQRYRLGWPRPLPVLPLVLTVVEDEASIVPNVDEVKQYVINVLEVQRVTWDGRVYFAYHHRYDCPPEVDDISLIIPSTQEASSWVNSLKEIRKYFSSKGIQYRIEFINFEAIDPQSMHTVLPDNPIVDLWTGFYRPKVLAAIQDKQWQSVNVVHCGFSLSRDECPVTVMIHAWDAEEDTWWNSTIPILNSICPFKIRLFAAYNITAMDRDLYASARSLLLEDFLGSPNIGASVGIKGKSGGGTLGGHLEIKWPDASGTHLGLTNHHVVLEDQLSKETQNNTAFSPGNLLSRNANLSITSPCDNDTTERIKVIETTLSKLNKKLHGDSTFGDIGLQQNVDFGDQSKAGALRTVLGDIAREQAERNQIASSDRHIGHVVASSGHRTVVKNGLAWGMDWALIELSDRRLVENRITRTSSKDDIHGLRGQEIECWSKERLRADAEVTKRGRTTGWTDGRVNAIWSDINIMKKENKKEFNPFGREIAAWLVLTTTEAGKFCSLGDSGALVLDSSTGSIVGLLFGSEIATGFGYVLPFDLVVEDIESVTGGKVIVPSKEK